jgi:hypothetical protein
VVALGALAWRLWRRSVPLGLWVALAVFVGLQTMEVLVAGPTRFPDAPRYLFANSLAVLLIAAEAAAVVRWRRAGLIVLYAFAVIGVATNIVLLRDSSSTYRLYAKLQSADLAAIDIAGESASASFDPRAVGPPESALVFPWATESIERPPIPAYRAAAREYEPFGFSLTELRGAAEIVRSRTDEFLAGVLGLGLTAAERGAAERCAGRAAGPDGAVHATVDAGRTAVIESDLSGAQVRVRRFATTSEHPVGDLEPSRAAFLTLPDDGAPDPWRVSVTASSARICERP